MLYTCVNPKIGVYLNDMLIPQDNFRNHLLKRSDIITIRNSKLPDFDKSKHDETEKVPLGGGAQGNVFKVKYEGRFCAQKEVLVSNRDSREVNKRKRD